MIINLDSLITHIRCHGHQSLAVVGKIAFNNCLVAMRLRSMENDLPSSDDMIKHLHNEFARWMHDMRANIEVS